MTLLAITVATMLLVSSQPGLSPNPNQEHDDPLVLQAVLEYSFIPEVKRMIGSTVSGAVLVLVVDHSIPLCKRREQGMPCRIPEAWQTLLIPNAPRGWAGLIDNDETRRSLVASLEARNGEAHALRLIDAPAVVLISSDNREKALQEYQGRTFGSVSLSVPGYSADGHAIVYGSYACGNMCGDSWLFVLERIADQWRVKSAAPTSIR